MEGPHITDAAQITVNLFLAGGAIVSILGIVLLLGVYIYRGFEKRTDNKLAELDKRIATVATGTDVELRSIREQVNINDKNMRDSSHEFRTTVAVTYVTRQELASSLRDLKDDMHRGFTDLKTFFIEPRKP